MTRYNKFITTVPAVVFLLALTTTAPSALAQSGPPDDAGPSMRYCVLLGMVGGTLPPECLDEDDQHDYSAELDQLRLATVAFHSHDVAAAAGWNEPISPCIEAPPGGMGYHIANLDYLADGGKLSLLQPEVLLYAPTEDGSMAFLGVEYIIPAGDWPHEEAPEFFGRELHFNPNLDIWALHVWSARHNPAGVFEDFNPDVNCEFAEE